MFCLKLHNIVVFNNGDLKVVTKAVLLRRVSTVMQEKDGNSLQNQLEILTEYCQKKGLTIIKDAELVESSTRGVRKKFLASNKKAVSHLYV